MKVDEGMRQEESFEVKMQVNEGCREMVERRGRKQEEERNSSLTGEMLAHCRRFCPGLRAHTVQYQADIENSALVSWVKLN